MTAVMDLNCDLGEGFGVWQMGDDDALLSVVTSANVACGFHGGDPSIMRRVCDRAVANGVAIGAHIGYRDLAGFGRRAIDVEPLQLADEAIYQIAALDGFARLAGSRVSYVKPHGALYNRVADDPVQAAALVEAVRLVDPALPVLGLPGSEWLRLADGAGITTVAEGFADRAYTADGRLASRRLPGTVLYDGDVIAERSVGMAVDGKVRTLDGSAIRMPIQSLCVHGDTPGAVDIARRVRTALTGAGVRLEPFAA